MSESFLNLTKSLTQELDKVLSSDELDDAGKMRLSIMLEQAQKRIEPPLKFLFNLAQASIAPTVTRIAIAMGIFDAFAASGEGELTLEELKPKTKGDMEFLTRIMRLLVGRGLTEVTATKKWRLTPMGRSLTTGSTSASMVIHSYYNVKAHGSMLDFLEKTNFKNPSNHNEGPWQYAYDTKETYFEWMQSGDPLRQSSFNALMKINQQFRGQDWFDVYPVEERLKSKPDETLLIDIGGGLGHDTIAFRNRFPNLPGKVILQDLPQVVSSITDPLPTGFEVQAYNAFSPQPVRGAKAYYLRTVIHDFPDAPARQILENVRQAMDETSILLINENVMPDDPTGTLTVDFDFLMMTLLASLERTEGQWLRLLDSAGFKVIKVWRPTQEVSSNALFEAVPK